MFLWAQKLELALLLSSTPVLPIIHIHQAMENAGVLCVGPVVLAADRAVEGPAVLRHLH